MHRVTGRMLVPIEFGEITLICRNQSGAEITLELSDVDQTPAGPVLLFEPDEMVQCLRLEMVLLSPAGSTSMLIGLKDQPWANAHCWVPLTEPWSMFPND